MYGKTIQTTRQVAKKCSGIRLLIIVSTHIESHMKSMGKEVLTKGVNVLECKKLKGILFSMYEVFCFSTLAKSYLHKIYRVHHFLN